MYSTGSFPQAHHQLQQAAVLTQWKSDTEHKFLKYLKTSQPERSNQQVKQQT